VPNQPPDSDTLGRAAAFAARHHGDQRRKDANETPHISHLLAVAALALEDGGSQDHAVAALLHDTLEDCPTVTTELLIEEFGAAVTAIVVGCTDHTPGIDCSGFTKWLVAAGHLESSPFDSDLVTVKATTEATVRAFTADDVVAMIETASKPADSARSAWASRDAALVDLLASTAVRSGECVALQIGDIGGADRPVLPCGAEPNPGTNVRYQSPATPPNGSPSTSAARSTTRRRRAYRATRVHTLKMRKPRLLS